MCLIRQGEDFTVASRNAPFGLTKSQEKRCPWRPIRCQRKSARDWREEETNSIVPGTKIYTEFLILRDSNLGVKVVPFPLRQWASRIKPFQHSSEFRGSRVTINRLAWRNWAREMQVGGRNRSPLLAPDQGGIRPPLGMAIRAALGLHSHRRRPAGLGS